MIYYESGGIHFILKVFRLKGSVFLRSLAVAVPCAAVCCGLKYLALRGVLPTEWDDTVLNNAVWSGFSVLVGFLIIFRTSQSYLRFWEGCTATHSMRAQWFDACSALIAFCKYSKCDDQGIRNFQSLLVRLFSMLHAAALGEIEGSVSHNIDEVQAFRLELIDAQGIDEESLVNLLSEERKVQLIYQWIQNLIVTNMRTGILEIPPPILTRAFGQIANGMVAFHDAVKLSDVPFPFPYAQMCDFLLLLHWLIVPWVVYPWVTSPVWAFIFCFIQVFILWSLNFIAVEIEHPFGMDDNDLDGRYMQVEMNMDLRMLLRPHAIQVPKLRPRHVEYHDWEDGDNGFVESAGRSFKEVWDAVDASRHQPLQRMRSQLKKKQASRTSICSIASVGTLASISAPPKLDVLSASLIHGHRNPPLENMARQISAGSKAVVEDDSFSIASASDDHGRPSSASHGSQHPAPSLDNAASEGAELQSRDGTFSEHSAQKVQKIASGKMQMAPAKLAALASGCPPSSSGVAEQGQKQPLHLDNDLCQKDPTSGIVRHI